MAPWASTWPATFAEFNEPFESWPMHYRLIRLEKLGYLDTDQWLAWREVRNRLAHEYPDHPELRFAALLANFAAASALSTLCDQWSARLEVAGVVDG